MEENQEIYVDRLEGQAKTVQFETLARGDFEGGDIEIGSPYLDMKVEAQIVENVKGDKIHIRRFRAKSRHRKTTGFRPYLTKIKITKV